MTAGSCDAVNVCGTSRRKQAVYQTHEQRAGGDRVLRGGWMLRFCWCKPWAGLRGPYPQERVSTTLPSTVIGRWPKDGRRKRRHGAADETGKDWRCVFWPEGKTRVCRSTWTGSAPGIGRRHGIVSTLDTAAFGMAEDDEDKLSGRTSSSLSRRADQLPRDSSRRTAPLDTRAADLSWNRVVRLQIYRCFCTERVIFLLALQLWLSRIEVYGRHVWKHMGPWDGKLGGPGGVPAPWLRCFRPSSEEETDERGVEVHVQQRCRAWVGWRPAKKNAVLDARLRGVQAVV